MLHIRKQTSENSKQVYTNPIELILKLITILTPFLNYCFAYLMCLEEYLQLVPLLVFMGMTVPFLISVAFALLILYLLPYYFRKESKGTWYQLILNVLLLLPPVLFQIKLWADLVLLLFPMTSDLLGFAQNLPNLVGYNSIYWILNYVGEMLSCTTIFEILQNKLTSQIIAYLLLFVAYVIIGRIRNNRKEQSS